MSSQILRADGTPYDVTVSVSSRSDAWENPVTGFGTSYDKTAYTRPGRVRPLDQNTLANMYDGDDIVARIVDTIPEECLRKAYSLEVNDAPLEDALTPEQAEALEAWNIDERVVEADKWGRLHGGAVILLDFADQAYELPVTPERVPPLLSMRVVDRWWLSPASYYAKGPKRGMPETYFVHEPGGAYSEQASRTIHESRMIIFRGVSTGRIQQQALSYWDYSVMQRVAEIVASFATGYKAVEILLTDGPQAAYGIQGLKELIGAGGQEKLARRMQLIDMMRSAMRAIVFDKEHESFDRKQISFSGIDTILDKLMLRLAAAARMPVTILMGQSPAGMNATGDSDFRWFYDTIATRQKNYIRPRLLQLYRLVLASMGVKFKTLDVKFKPLWEPTAKEAAEIDKIKADTASVLMGAMVLTPEEYALAPCFDAEEWGVDVGARRKLLEAAAKESEASEPELDDEGNPIEPEPELDDEGNPVPVVPIAGVPALGARPGAAPAGETKDAAKEAFNGAQVTALIDIVAKVANKEIPPESAVAIIALAFPVTPEQAKQMVTPAVEFEPPPPEPSPFGQPPPGAPGAPTKAGPPAPPGGDLEAPPKKSGFPPA